MEKLNPEIKIQEIDDKVVVKQRAQDTLENALQPSMTTPVSTSWSTSGGTATHLDASNSTRLDNMYTRINEIETALVQLGILKSR